MEESWKLHDAVEVGGGDLEERGEVGAFDQDGAKWAPSSARASAFSGWHDQNGLVSPCLEIELELLGVCTGFHVKPKEYVYVVQLL